MADNSAQTAADTIRDKDRSGVKTQIVGLDLGIGTGTESLMSGTMPISVSTAILQRQSAYTAAAANVFTGSELTTLGAGSYCTPSTAIDNSSVLDLYDDLEMVVSLAATAVVNTMIEVYLIPSLDGGTNYADGSSSVVPASNLYVGGFPVRAVTTAQRMLLRGVPIPPGLFKYQIKNATAVAFTATATPQLRRRSYSMQLG